MINKKNIQKQVDEFHQLDDRTPSLDMQLDKLIALLEKSELDSKKAIQLRNRFEKAVSLAQQNREGFKAYEQLDLKNGLSRAEMIDNMQVLLMTHQLDSKKAKRYLLEQRLKKAIMVAIALVLITLGFAMIIMPAPPYFEMFTIFYFSPDDGVTLMDIISLLVILSGVYLMVRSVFHRPNSLG